MAARQTETELITALYERLSRDDELSGTVTHCESEKTVGGLRKAERFCQSPPLYGRRIFGRKL